MFEIWSTRYLFRYEDNTVGDSVYVIKFDRVNMKYSEPEIINLVVDYQGQINFDAIKLNTAFKKADLMGCLKTHTWNQG